ncbi:hypothetical protein POF50_023615 [Streptomyces sp. SL13]|uniref:Uncharacterized protein n=1 Tax=Streptantibioticus silvisoli TaxID=2705255 RepID=A0AA90H1F8_9ACTN|nr:hypothetical protein [Streptantibioticus silvisoli]MDI5972288.1 hypothetical protein [Streptantibioticus silvisoli]
MSEIRRGGLHRHTHRPRFFALALAALRYGYCLFPLYPPLFRSGTGSALQTDLKAAPHVTATQTPVDTPVPLPCPTATERALCAGGGSCIVPVAARAGYLAFATSGTTGEPQAVPRARPSLPYRGVAVNPRVRGGSHP